MDSAAIIDSVAAEPIIVAIAVGLVTGYVLDEIDTRTGATVALIKGYEKIGLKLKEIEYEAAIKQPICARKSPIFYV